MTQSFPYAKIDIIQKGGGFSPMKILSRGGNWQTGLASRTILLQLFCDCPAVAPLHSVVGNQVNLLVIDDMKKY